MLTVLMSMAVSACAALADGSKPLRFELQGHAMVVPATVSGQGPFRFLLDTGASRSVISARVAARVSAVATSTTRMLTPSGHVIRPVVTVPLAVGDRPAVSVEATVISGEDMFRGGLQVDGIVGQDVLAPLAYTIDYARREIHWHAHVTLPTERLDLTVQDGRAMVTIPHRPRTLRLIADTGSDGFVFFGGDDLSLPAATPLDVALLRTLSGPQLVRRVLLDDFRVATTRLQKVHAAVVSPRHRLGTSDGLLPLSVFSIVVIDGPAGYLAVR